MAERADLDAEYARLLLEGKKLRAGTNRWNGAPETSRLTVRTGSGYMPISKACKSSSSDCDDKQ